LILIFSLYYYCTDISNTVNRLDELFLCRYNSSMVKPRGRPPKERGSTKTRYLQVRVSDPEKTAFDAAAGLAGLDVSAWVRERLRLAARSELEGYGKPVSFLKK